MKMNDAFPSKYLKAEDLEEGDLVVIINDAQFETFKDPRTQRDESKPVLHFQGDTKPLVLNKTNYKTISPLRGSDDTDDWSGRKSALYATEVESVGETVLGIRLRLKAPVKAKAATAKAALKAVEPLADDQQVDADEIPF